MFCTAFQIGGLCIGLEQPEAPLLTEGFQPFRTELPPQVRVRFSPRPTLNFPKGTPVYSDVSLAVYPEPAGGFVRVYHDHREKDRPYAMGWTNPNGSGGRVEYLSGDKAFFSETSNTFSHTALEELLLQHGRMILHAALIDSPWGGILFSGPSGIGKSTQAELWRIHRGSRIVNGDRPILGKTAKGWAAYGSPYAGSSRYFVNESLPVGAIVLLEQGKKEQIERLPVAAAFSLLYRQTTVNSWNHQFVEGAVELAAALAAECPVYRMRCTPSLRAVECLEGALKGTG